MIPGWTNALVVNRYRTVNLPYSDMLLSGVTIHSSPNIDILSVRFDRDLNFETNMHCVVLFVCQIVVNLWMLRDVFEDTFG